MVFLNLMVDSAVNKDSAVALSAISILSLGIYEENTMMIFLMHMRLMLHMMMPLGIVPMKVTQWRQREFKVGGDEVPKGMGPFPPAPGEGSGRGNFFVISNSKGFPRGVKQGGGW